MWVIAVPPSSANHLDRLIGRFALDVDNHYLGPGPRQQHRRRAAIADAIIRRAATGDDRHFPGKAEIVFRARVAHVRLANWVCHDSEAKSGALHAGSGSCVLRDSRSAASSG
jgi:hypothetical protein